MTDSLLQGRMRLMKQSRLSSPLSALFIATSCVVLSGCSSTLPAPVSSVNDKYERQEKGSHKGDYYKVQKDDTLYFIAHLTNLNVNDIIKANRLMAPYTIFPGQILSLEMVKPAPILWKTPTNQQIRQNVLLNDPVVLPSGPNDSIDKLVDNKKPTSYSASTSSKSTVLKKTTKDKKISNWLFPTKGKIIGSFSAKENGNKGIDIAGKKGQPIVAAAAGTVVYSGNALRGYGNLLIIKHNETHLSAYAHNEKLLVKDQEKVKAGQKIATMGDTEADRAKLHFEIRYRGKSIDPMRFLPNA
jgi:lipoprotein NlpD